jgi:hypothetical protein
MDSCRSQFPQHPNALNTPLLFGGKESVQRQEVVHKCRDIRATRLLL